MAEKYYKSQGKYGKILVLTLKFYKLGVFYFFTIGLWLLFNFYSSNEMLWTTDCQQRTTIILYISLLMSNLCDGG